MSRALIVPSRHLVFSQVLATQIAQLAQDVDLVIFAITSANQQHSRYNPIPFHIRAIGADRLARDLNLRHRIVGIPHYRPTDRFARNVVLEIEAQTELQLEPSSCVVLSPVDGVRAQFEALGFSVVEARDHGRGLLEQIATAGVEWGDDDSIVKLMHPASKSLFDDFPEAPGRVIRLYRDPLLTSQGSLTATRDYRVYVWGMSQPAVLAMKYADVRDLIVPGRIADEGCADGALLVEIAKDFPDSDLLGIEITGEFLAMCEERIRRGDYGANHVHIYQRNLFDEVFEDASVDTTICNSTLHELWSYGDQDETLHRYFRHKFAQTTPGGRIIVRDVVGPERGDAEVYMWCASDDGADEGEVASLCTCARFRKFAAEYLAVPFEYSEEQVDGETYFVLRHRDAVEFMTKKDYVENWNSEMHEAFAFWGVEEYKNALESAGFVVMPETRTYTNPWIVENRFSGKVRLFEKTQAGLRDLPNPPTTMVLVGKKPVAGMSI